MSLIFRDNVKSVTWPFNSP